LRKQLNMDYPYLSELLYESPKNYKITYNDHRFQKGGAGIQTCGRWSALRLVFRDLTLGQFAKLFNPKDKHSDDLVTLLTMFDLNY